MQNVPCILGAGTPVSTPLNVPTPIPLLAMALSPPMLPPEQHLQQMYSPVPPPEGAILQAQPQPTQPSLNLPNPASLPQQDPSISEPFTEVNAVVSFLLCARIDLCIGNVNQYNFYDHTSVEAQ